MSSYLRALPVSGAASVFATHHRNGKKWSSSSPSRPPSTYGCAYVQAVAVILGRASRTTDDEHLFSLFAVFLRLCRMTGNFLQPFSTRLNSPRLNGSQ